MTTTGEYDKPETTTDPVTMYGAWDDEAGCVTELVATEDDARLALGELLHEWAMQDLIPERTRLREFHVHDNGVTRTEDPADECPVCQPPTASDFGLVRSPAARLRKAV